MGHILVTNAVRIVEIPNTATRGRNYMAELYRITFSRNKKGAALPGALFIFT
jgi:hypothetical protein